MRGAVEGYGDCDAGGIIGSGNNATSNCYNVGPVKGYPDFGTINNDIGETKLAGIYYLKVNDFVLGVGDDTFHEGFDYASQLSNEQMQDRNSFDTFDFENVWTMAGDPSYPYPELRNVSMIHMPENTTDFAGGNGLPYSPFEISSPEQLDNIRNYMHGYFCLINDIDMTESTSESGVFYNSGHGFRPIGLDDDRCFIGCFDGNNHRIVGLKSDYPDEDYVGLFDFCYNSTIMDLELVDVDNIWRKCWRYYQQRFLHSYF